MCNFLTFVININRIDITSPIVNLLISRQSNLQQHTRAEEVKLQSNKVTLASPIQNLWFILFDRSSGRQSSLTVEPSRNSEDDKLIITIIKYFLWKYIQISAMG